MGVLESGGSYIEKGDQMRFVLELVAAFLRWVLVCEVNTRVRLV